MKSILSTLYVDYDENFKIQKPMITLKNLWPIKKTGVGIKIWKKKDEVREKKR